MTCISSAAVGLSLGVCQVWPLYTEVQAVYKKALGPREQVGAEIQSQMPSLSCGPEHSPGKESV